MIAEAIWTVIIISLCIFLAIIFLIKGPKYTDNIEKAYQRAYPKIKDTWKEDDAIVYDPTMHDGNEYG